MVKLQLKTPGGAGESFGRLGELVTKRTFRVSHKQLRACIFNLVRHCISEHAEGPHRENQHQLCSARQPVT